MGEWVHIAIEAFFLLALWLAVWSITRSVKQYLQWRKK